MSAGCGGGSGVLDFCKGHGSEGEKMAWPELVGTNGHEAVKIIMKENPNVKAIYFPGKITICDIVCSRVYVFVDKSGNVIQVPMIG